MKHLLKILSGFVAFGFTTGAHAAAMDNLPIEFTRFTMGKGAGPRYYWDPLPFSRKNGTYWFESRSALCGGNADCIAAKYTDPKKKEIQDTVRCRAGGVSGFGNSTQGVENGGSSPNRWRRITGDFTAIGNTPKEQREFGTTCMRAGTGTQKFTDEAMGLVYMARKFNQYGGYFCVTQLRSRNGSTCGAASGSGSNMVVCSGYEEPAGNAGCAWFCKPGYTGGMGENDECRPIESREDIYSCMDTRVSTYAGQANFSNSDNNISDKMYANAVLATDGELNKSEQNDIIVIAEASHVNADSIKASPYLFKTHCGMPGADDGSCTQGESTFHLTYEGIQEAGGVAVAVLCKPGFSGPNCTRSEFCDAPKPTKIITINSLKDCLSRPDISGCFDNALKSNASTAKAVCTPGPTGEVKSGRSICQRADCSTTYC